MPQELSNSVFISYRRSASAITVLAIYQHLSAHGIDAFYDIENIKAGQFGEIILGQIAARPYFMPVFAPGSLDRCVNEGDWVRREIEHAVSKKRLLVPLYTPDFDFKDLDHYLPHLATTIRAYNMVELPTQNMKWFRYTLRDVVETYLNPISIDLTPVSSTAAAEVARTKEALDATPVVTEKQLTAQELLNPHRLYEIVDGVVIEKQLTAQDYFNRGYAAVEAGRWDDGIRDYSEAIRLKPDYTEAYNNRGNSYLDKGDKDGAIADYNEAIRLKSDYAAAYWGRGNAHDKKGDRQGAVAEYSRYLELVPNASNVQWMRDYIAQYGK